MSAQYFAAQGLTSDDMQGDITLRCLTYVNTKADTALATLAGLPSDVASYATTLSSLVVDMNKLKNYQVVNVKEYGATGNGSTNDTLALNLAAGAIPTDGGILYFPTGTYLITNTVSIINRTNLLIKSDSAIIKPNNNGSGLYFNNCPHLQIEGSLSLACGSTALVNSFGLVIQNCQFSNIKNIFIIGDFAVGIYCNANGPSYAVACSIEATVSGCRTGILMAGEYYELCNCKVTNCKYGVDMSYGNSQITGGNFNYNKIGIMAVGGNGNSDHGRITGATVNHNDACGIFLKNLIYSMSITGCQIWATIITTNPLTEAAAVAARIGNFGVYIENSRNVNISGCHIARNIQNLGLDGYCMCNISNNNFLSDTGRTTIHVAEFGATNTAFGLNAQNIISNNIFDGALTSGFKRFYFFDTLTLSRANLIKNNMGTCDVNYLMMNAVGATYEIGQHDSYIVDTSVINVAYSSSTPNDQSTNIYILPHMMGIPFEITVKGFITEGGFWLRVKTTSTNLPIITAIGSISYYLAHKAIFVSARNIKFTPFGAEGPQWVLSIY
jgi:hypothetical protein